MVGLTLTPALASPWLQNSDRLYQDIALRIIKRIASGQYQVGDRLPAERDLAQELKVSRPTIREAVIALELLGLVEVRIGSGSYVRQLPDAQAAADLNVTAFELTEARALFESEAAALAAAHITDAELEQLESLVHRMGEAVPEGDRAEEADRAFHLLIAQATRNTAVAELVAEMWNMRSTSPACALLLAKARSANVMPVFDEHMAIVEALRTRDPNAARSAMRNHLSAVMDHLLFATEEEAVENARRATAQSRARFGRVVGG